jgi:Tfp pilus assembly protein PilF
MYCVGRRFSFLPLFLLLFVLPSIAQGDRSSITGFVFGDDRRPVARLNVELQTEMYSTLARTQTNGAGMYSFRGLSTGTYTVKILTFGTDFEEQSKSVPLVPISIVSGRGSVSEQVDFYLTVRKRPGLHGPGGAVFVQEIPREAQTLYESGLNDLEAKKEIDAFGKIKRSLEIFPDYYLALDKLATEYLAKGYYEAAQILFTKAIAVNPRSISSGVGLGLTEIRLGRTDKAIASFDSVIKLEKENVSALYWKGVALHSSKRLDEALASLQKAEKLSDGKFADVYWQLARVYKDKNRFRESAESLETFLKIRPDAQNAAEIRQIIKTLREKPVT